MIDATFVAFNAMNVSHAAIEANFAPFQHHNSGAIDIMYWERQHITRVKNAKVCVCVCVLSFVWCVCVPCRSGCGLR